MGKAGKGFKAKRKGFFFTHCVETVIALSLLQNVKIYLAQKSLELLEKSLHKVLLWPSQFLSYESLELGKILLRNIAAYSSLLAPFCLCIHYSHHPVPGGTALLCPGTEKAPS